MMRYIFVALLLSGCGYPPIAERVPAPKAAVEWPVAHGHYERLQKAKPPLKLAPLAPITPIEHDPICDITQDDKEGVKARLECIVSNLR